MRQALLQLISSGKEKVGSLVSSYAFNRPKDMLREYVQRLDELQRNLGISLAHHFQRSSRDVESLAKRLSGLGPSNVLKRGYAIVRRGKLVVTHAQELERDDMATIEFQDGTVATKVQR